MPSSWSQGEHSCVFLREGELSHQQDDCQEQDQGLVLRSGG